MGEVLADVDPVDEFGVVGRALGDAGGGVRHGLPELLGRHGPPSASAPVAIMTRNWARSSWSVSASLPQIGAERASRLSGRAKVAVSTSAVTRSGWRAAARMATGPPRE
ncbi:hypothetical protein GCM10020254_45510 [Streptomyces goshikiensis]